ncbi:histidine kinase/DNA gyrase B/HSP90-like ATPase [Thermomonospora umbrina]|uniref:Histidine kinase/DNA gyrase B/HSP90-like ATPase n=1 Tax=Thermomonospora umbrina TaxID=111806 RepID=A0A3D9STI2_9ACTN|nr:histidine kinase/DNA gyrase B/HSP90-like ATPase [Thermomonospora umbrina]
MRDRRAVRAALLLTLAAVALVAASLGLGLDVPAARRMVWWHPEIVIALTWTPVAYLLVRHRPGLHVGWLMLVAGFSAAVYVLSLNLGPWLELNEHPGAWLFRWLGHWLWAVDTFALTLVLPLIFPDGRLVSRWFRPVLAAAFATPLIVCVHLTVDPEARRFHNGVSVYPFQDIPLAISVTIIGTLLAGLVSVALRFWRSPADVRRQIAWVIYPGVLAQTIIYVGETTPIGDPLRNVTIATVPICIAIAITRYRLYDIDLVISRTLVYAGLAVVITGVYFALVGTASLVLSGRGPMAGLVGAIAAGAVFEPVRRRLQRTVDRLLHGERDPYRIADRLNRRLQTASDPAAALAIAASVVREALRAAGVTVEVLGREGRAAIAEDGDLGADPESIPLIWHGRPVGRLLYSRAEIPDRRIASVMARNLAELANAVRLAADVQRSRERILATREEERRRLRRDLHDGLGPTLASLAMTVDAARITLHRDPAAVDPLLEKLRTTMSGTIGDIRELVYGLRPPALDDLGLAGAVRALADGTAGGPRVDVLVDGELDDLPAAVEVAAYRIAQEALTNARRHARAGIVLVRLDRGGELHLSVADDGVGLPEHARAGVGMSSMRERAAELGGSCSIGPGTAGGTLVQARLPINGAP